MRTNLAVRHGERDVSFNGSQVKIGSHPDCDFQLSGREVLAEHVIVSRDGDRWKVERLGPPRSMYVDGRSRAAISFSVPLSVRLGDTDGPEITLLPRPQGGSLDKADYWAAEFASERRRSNHRFVLVTAFLAAVVLVLGLIVAYEGRIEDWERDQALRAVRNAAVRLVARDSDGRGLWAGSGTIVDETGLILTNAHVAAPDAPGLNLVYGSEFPKASPAWLEVWMTPDGGDRAEVVYRAETVVADGWLDLAVVRVTADSQGVGLVHPLELPTINMGRGASLDRGSNIYVVGYPGISGGEAQRITPGAVAAYLDDERMPTERDVIDTTAQVTPGNSGGAAVDSDGRFVGVPMASKWDDRDPVTAGRLRPVEYADVLLERARDGTAGEYRTPYVTSPTGDERVDVVGWAEAETDGSCAEPRLSDTIPTGANRLCVVLAVSGMAADLDVTVRIPEANAAAHRQANGRERLSFSLTLDKPAVGTLEYRVDLAGGAASIPARTVEAT